MNPFEEQIAEVEKWFANPCFEGIVRLYSPRQVAEQQGTIRRDYTVTRTAAEVMIRSGAAREMTSWLVSLGPTHFTAMPVTTPSTVWLPISTATLAPLIWVSSPLSA